MVPRNSPDKSAEAGGSGRRPDPAEGLHPCNEMYTLAIKLQYIILLFGLSRLHLFVGRFEKKKKFMSLQLQIRRYSPKANWISRNF